MCGLPFGEGRVGLGLAAYLDGDRFGDAADLIEHLKCIGQAEFSARQRSMQAFLSSPAGLRHGQDHFCRTLVAGILGDLGIPPPV